MELWNERGEPVRHRLPLKALWKESNHEEHEDGVRRAFASLKMNWLFTRSVIMKRLRRLDQPIQMG